ncbi:polysaccharide biosynthesis protein [Cylindrospermum sp. NIES-4074]|nr:polysaccharide biosynthesis protein [Cylindrospermum sp. NIES-4074]
MRQIKPLTLRRNFSWTFAGNLVYAACQWGMLVVLAKLGSPEMVGQFTLGLAIAAPVIMLTNLQLRTIQVTDAKQEYLFQDYLGLRLIMTGLAMLIIVVITIASGYRWETTLVIFAIALAKAFESISDVYYGLIQQRERMDRIAMSLMIKGPLSLILLGLGFYLTGSVLGAAVGLLVAWSVVLFSYDIRNGASILKTLPNSYPQNSLLPRWHLKTLGQLIWLALPLGFVMMLISLNANIPRYFIARYLGERELGIFAALAYLMVAGNIVVQALGESASARLAKYYAAGNRLAYGKLLLKLMGTGLLLATTGLLVAGIAGKEILILLYGVEYAKHTDLFISLMFVSAIDYVFSFLGHAMTSARYFRIQMPLFILTTTTSAIASLWLIPSIGLRGVPIALSIAGVIRATMSLGVICHALRLFPRQKGSE